MNLIKDRSILELLSRLDIGNNRWRIQDHWDADLCAIGLSSDLNPQHLVYVSTFDREAGRYDFECEIVDKLYPEKYTVANSGANVDFLTLYQAIRHHLDEAKKEFGP